MSARREPEPKRLWNKVSLLAGTMLFLPLLILVAPTSAKAESVCTEFNTVHADVVALDQFLTFNRLGAVNPQGMIFALARDVFPKSTLPENQTLVNSCLNASCSPGDVKLRDDKRPRPIVLRANEGECLEIALTNLFPALQNAVLDPVTGIELNEQPATRSVSIHITGMQLSDSIADDGSNVGNNVSSLVAPGASHTYKVYAEKEDTFLLYSTGTNVGGEGGSGTHAWGLFGMVNVEPVGADWYRSQLTRAELEMAIDPSFTDACDDGNGGFIPSPAGYFCTGHPKLDYSAVYPATHPFAGLPIVNMKQGNTIVHSDLNAIIANFDKVYTENPAYPNRQQSFREFSVAFHDEIKAIQAFDMFRDNEFAFTLSGVVDGFAINYGTGGVGAEVIANRIGVGPMHDCVDCKYEEFFLTSWTVGDPAMVVDISANAVLDGAGGIVTPPFPRPIPPGAPVTPGPKATFAFYPDDPANVFHSYQNDHVKIRNVHVGSEQHLFHLHAHQWLFTPDDDNSNYLDAQAVGPGSGYTYDIVYNGSGNRNKSLGDSIFHCHFYPHFAQGMWALWRVHDVFEIGTLLDTDPNLPLGHGKPAAGARALPDGEIAAGTPIPSIVPMPGLAMAPNPEANVEIVNGQAVITPLDANFDYDGDGINGINAGDADDIGNPGYPLFIAGVAGHRPPTPPLDMAADVLNGGLLDGGLPRHVIISDPDSFGATAGPAVDQTQSPLSFDKILLAADALHRPEEGTAIERAAMRFHGGHWFPSVTQEGDKTARWENNGMPPVSGAPYAEPCRPDVFTEYGEPGGPINAIGNPRTYRAAVIETDVTLNKIGWHFNQQRLLTLEGDVQDTLDKIRPPEPFVMRANTGDCIDYYHTNLVPNIYKQDDFQVRTPTDVIGQHIHLVKFDVTSSDGSANGWNYEDGTFSPDEVIERIHAIRAFNGCVGHDSGDVRDGQVINDKLICPVAKTGFRDVLGARTTVQRWYVDPLVNNLGEDRGLGNVFTHDHFGPSTHQQAGLYGTLLVEPEGSQWRDSESGIMLGQGRADGGPTSWRADILAGDDSFREFYLEFSDFQLAYEAGAPPNEGGTALPVNQPVKDEVDLPQKDIIVPGEICPNGSPAPCPEAISASDPGTFVVNYRMEPIGLRVSEPDGAGFRLQSPGLAGDLSYVHSSKITRGDPLLNVQPTVYPPLTADVQPKDPYTPLLRTYNGDDVRVRVQIGATEEMHNASIHGVKWTQEYNSRNTGWRNAQAMGISEQFQFLAPVTTSAVRAGTRADYLYKPNSSVDAQWSGAWGLMRNYATLRSDLAPLPNNPITTTGLAISNKADFNEMCPKIAPVRAYSVTAVLARDALPGGTLTYNSRIGAAAGFEGPLHDPTSILYVLSEDLNPDGTLKADAPIEPLILRAAAGECIQVSLKSNVENIPELDGLNTMPMLITTGGRDGGPRRHFNANNLNTSPSFGLHPQLVAYDVTRSDGANVGLNRRTQTVKKGDRRPVLYRWYAGDVRLDGAELKATPIELGGVNLMSSDPIKHSSKGAIGALVVLPEGSSWVENDLDHVTLRRTRASATVSYAPGQTNENGQSTFRDFVLIHQDDINMRLGNGEAQPTVAEQEDAEDTGQRAFNYRTEPAWFRLGFTPTINEGITGQQDYTNLLSNTLIGGDPETPIFSADAGDEVRFRVLQPGGHNRMSVFTLHGHVWQREPYIDTDPLSDNIGSTAIGNNPLSRWIGAQEGHGPANHFDVVPRNGAGGINQVSGDYLYRDNVPVHFNNGSWGIFRVNENPPAP